MELSFPCQIAMHLSYEYTVALHQENVPTGFLFAALLKLGDFLEDDFLNSFNDPEIARLFYDEVDLSLEALRKLGLEITPLRRRVRGLIGDGGYRRHPNETVHRSAKTRSIFDEAKTLASSNQESMISMQRMLQAVLLSDDQYVTFVINDYGVQPADCYNALSDLSIAPSPAPEQIGQEPSTSSTAERRDPRTTQQQTVADESENPAEESGSPVLNEFLKRYCVDLVQAALENKISDVYQREDELYQIITTLSRAGRSNPVLLGDPGVGKTAIIEGLAYRIAKGRVPVHFRDKRILSLDLPTLVSGTKYAGSIEERLVQLIESVQADDRIILFIDEIHMLIGVGGNSPMNGANMLKSALNQPTFSVIGTTTNAEYKQYIEDDPAFTRRLVPIKVREPNAETTTKIMMDMLEELEASHDNMIEISEEAIVTAVRLADRYMPSRAYPDKAIELLDEACAVARVGANRETYDYKDQGVVQVTASHVHDVIRMRDNIEDDDAIRGRLRSLERDLKDRIIGQDDAIYDLVQAIQLSYLDLTKRGKPVGVFLFIGPTGVGKTQLAKATAEIMFEGEQNIIRIDMSEYMERHSVARLIGSPPGYVGYAEGGQLTEALKINPQSIVLLDEIEKAHSDVLNIFLQVFDDGRLTDSHGRTVDASRSLFIMTSNLGYDMMHYDGGPPSDEHIEREIDLAMRPEFTNRIDKIVFFRPLHSEHMKEIVRIHFKGFKSHLHQAHQITVELSDAAIEWLAENGYDATRGARPVVRLIEREIIQPIGGLLVQEKVKQGAILNIDVDIEKDKLRIDSDTTGNETM